jgi:hypothetical protein
MLVGFKLFLVRNILLDYKNIFCLYRSDSLAKFPANKKEFGLQVQMQKMFHLSQKN